LKIFPPSTGGSENPAIKKHHARRASQSEVRKRILQAATHLFLTEGYLATKTRHIAARANVNEALIFYHFKDKQNLRWTVFEDVRISTHVTEMIEGWLLSGLSDEKLFAGMAENFLRLLEEDDNMLRLLLASDLRDGGCSQSLIARFYRRHILKSYDLLAKYIRLRTREGIFRRVDPWLASRAFFSLVCYHVIVQDFFGGKYTHVFPRKKVARVVSEIWLNGLRRAPTESKRNRPIRARAIAGVVSSGRRLSRDK
jgi:AcrR family transcriptional regulator